MKSVRKPSRLKTHAQLRARAEALLRDGSAGTSKGGTLGIDALELLYRRASEPEFAADALKLLHELQTHQVELDLLIEQLQSNEDELTHELAYYRALYELAPVAYLVITRDGRVVESNAAASALLGFASAHSGELSEDEEEEQRVTRYLSPSSQAAVTTMIQGLDVPGSAASCLAQLADSPDSQLAIKASLSSSGDSILMAVWQGPD
ncbi:MAG: PAS domain-containing protein [Pseudohongiellaceae bacterium]